MKIKIVTIYRDPSLEYELGGAHVGTYTIKKWTPREIAKAVVKQNNWDKTDVDRICKSYDSPEEYGYAFVDIDVRRNNKVKNKSAMIWTSQQEIFVNITQL